MIIYNEKKHIDTLYQTGLLITDIKNYALFTNRSFENTVFLLKGSGKFDKLDFISVFCLSDNNLSVPERWKSSVYNSSCKLYQWEKDVIIRLCNSLCVCTRENIEEYCEKALSDIESFICSAKEKKEKITKTRAVFTVSTGVMIALLFI